jgi:steroid 5-alpha reductase family enzyme
VVAATNAAGFLVTAVTQSHKITDLTGTAAFAASAWATHSAACRALGTPLLAPSRGVLLAGCVSLWAARLGGYLFYRVLQVRGSSAVRWGLWGRGAGFWGRRSGLHLGLPWGEPLGA